MIRGPRTRTGWTITLLITFAILLLAWGSYWFFTHHERRYEESRGDISPLARRNPLLAAERFLTRAGIPTESLADRGFLDHPPTEPGLLLVGRLGRGLPEGQPVLDWVERGGQLVIIPTRPWSEEAPSSALLDAFSVRLIELSWGDEEEFHEVLPFEPLHGSEPPQVRFRRNRVLEDREGRADWVLRGESGAHLLHYRHGNGSVTLLSDGEMLSNLEIAELDHALFLARLAEEAPQAWLLYSSDAPPLLHLLWRNLPQLSLVAPVMLLLLLWWLRFHTGPPIPPPPRVRRNLLENLKASANYAWATDRGERLLRSNRVALDKRWQHRYPLPDTADQEARFEWIAARTGLTRKGVALALTEEAPREGAFIRVTAAQQRLVRAVTRAGEASKPGSR